MQGTVIASSVALFENDLHVVTKPDDETFRQLCRTAWLHTNADGTAIVTLEATYHAMYDLDDTDAVTASPRGGDIAFIDVHGHRYILRKPTEADSDLLAFYGFRPDGTEIPDAEA